MIEVDYITVFIYLFFFYIFFIQFSVYLLFVLKKSVIGHLLVEKSSKVRRKESVEAFKAADC